MSLFQNQIKFYLYSAKSHLALTNCIDEPPSALRPSNKVKKNFKNSKQGKKGQFNSKLRSFLSLGAFCGFGGFLCVWADIIILSVLSLDPQAINDLETLLRLMLARRYLQNWVLLAIPAFCHLWFNALFSMFWNVHWCFKVIMIDNCCTDVFFSPHFWPFVKAIYKNKYERPCKNM